MHCLSGMLDSDGLPFVTVQTLFLTPPLFYPEPPHPKRFLTKKRWRSGRKTGGRVLKRKGGGLNKKLEGGDHAAQAPPVQPPTAHELRPGAFGCRAARRHFAGCMTS